MRKYLIPILAIGTAVMIYIMVTTGTPLKTPATPKGILDLEFAYDRIHTDAVLTAWSVDGKKEAAIKNTLWDFCFLVFYSLFLFSCCKKLSEKFAVNDWKYGAARAFAKVALLVGLLDIGENMGMLQTLDSNGGDTVAMVTAACASIKWILVILVILYILFALLSKRSRP